VRYLIVGVVALISLSIGAMPREALALEGDTIARVDAFIESEMRDAGIPGVALAIVEGDRAVHLRGFGVADSSGRAVTPQTAFPIASMSKTFTALAVMQLVEAGKLGLDTAVRAYIPWFDVGHDPAAADITVRHLLTQRSGISGETDVVAFEDGDRSPAALEHNVRRFATVERLIAAPGAEFHYCNANFDVLGYLIEVVSGESYETYVQHHIFDPLEMSHTFGSISDARGQGLAAGFYRWWGVPLETDMLPPGRASVPSAGLASSVEDLSHWLIAHLNAGRYRDVSLLSADGIAQEHRAAGSDFDRYAMGWFVSPAWDAAALRPDGSTFDVPIFLSHGGIHPADHGSLELFPDRGFAFAILMNTYDATTPSRYEHVDWGIRAILLGKEPGPIVFDEPLLRYLKVIALGLVAMEAVVAAWSIRSSRAGSRMKAAVAIAGMVFAASLAFAFAYVPGQLHSYLVGVALGRVSDMSLMAFALVAIPIVWAIALVLVGRRRRAHHIAAVDGAAD
jgi:CubicO group peptidase (beta-lactamase class C family)